jgi:ribosomal protein L11 methyltransferase
MPTVKATWTGPLAPLEAASILLTEALHPAAGAVSLTKADDAASDDATAWRLDAYFAAAPDPQILSALLADFAGLESPSYEELPDIDWVAHSLTGLGIVRAGRFVLYGSHDAARLPDLDGDIPIRIDANEAFGTGHHATTAGCLTLLDRLGGIRPERIFDLGTGSAVLAIAAAKIWDRPILGSDIDRRSVEIARENVRLNGEDGRVAILEADGFAAPAIASAAPFDFIFANILAGPLIDLAPQMATNLAAGGRLMLAGMMADQETAVAEAYARAGLRRLNKLDHGTWPVLLYVRP